MLGSKSVFFQQSEKQLAEKRKLLIHVLSDYGIQNKDRWLTSFDYFCINKTAFDGATIVKDNFTINGYDASAGNHDFGYINNKLTWKFWKWFKQSIKLDVEYLKDMKSLKLSQYMAYARVILLITIKPVFMFYLIYKHNKK